MQKENPPTHLIRSRTGDFLRGRLIKLDATRCSKSKSAWNPEDIARDRLALIIWLHPDELGSGPQSSASRQTSDGDKGSDSLQ